MNAAATTSNKPVTRPNSTSPKTRVPSESFIRSPAEIAAVVRKFYEYLAQENVPGLLGLLHAQLEWTEAESFPYYSGTWRTGKELVDNLLTPLTRDWEGFSARPHDFITEGNRVVTLGTYTGKFTATGKSMSAPFAHVWTIQNDQIARFDMYVDSVKVLAAMK